MRIYAKLIVLGLGASLSYAQLTMDQKVSDFQAMAGLYAKRYGPYAWKLSTFNYDLLNITPWLSQIQATKNDLDFYDVMSNYVASLNDAHDTYLIPSNFGATLNFYVDVYDGKLLVDSINRTRLPAAEFPFLIGYELVSIDGQDAQKMVDGLLRYSIAANPRSTRRIAAEYLTGRYQELIPNATDLPEISTVVFRRPDQNLETYRIPWAKSGLPLTSVGKYITPQARPGHAVPGPSRRQPPVEGTPSASTEPAYLQVLHQLWNCRLPDRAVNGFGALAPIFSAGLLPGFTIRLGKSAQDPFYSGVFTANGHKVGFIRIPDYGPTDEVGAITAFAKEIAFFEANTDGLVVDEMRNPGGDVAYLNAILSYLMPNPWSSITFEVRATSEWVVEASSAYSQALSAGAPQSYLDLLQMLINEVQAANRQLRGMTPPLPLDDVTIERNPATDSKGNVVAYTKPLMVLVDELSASAADAFAATIQDNTRGPLFGWRTMGAGGNVEEWEAGSYSLGYVTVTESLMHRNHTIVTSDYPAAPYVENIGVRPEIPVDYMTRDNLMQNGKPFVDALVAAIAGQIEKGN